MNIFLAELIGTMILVLLGNGSVANVLLARSKGFHSGWIVIAAGWGFGVAIAVYAVGWISGGHLNPAVTLGLTLAGKSSPALMPLYFIGQFLGAMAGAFLVYCCYYPHWKMTLEPHSKLLCFATAPAIKRPFWNCITEVIGTAALLIGILAIIDVHNELSNGMGPYAMGILIFSIGVSLGGPTGYAINPARDLGPRLVHFMLPIPGKGPSNWNYAWVPIIGPLIGALIGVWIYTSCLQKLGISASIGL